MSSQQYFISYPLEAIAYLLYGVTLILYLLKVQKKIRFKILIIYFLIGLSILLRVLTVTGGNNFYYSLLYVVNSLGWGTYFYLVFQSKLIKGVAVCAVLTTVSYFVFRNILFTPEKIFDSMGYVISSTGTVLLVFIYFYQLLSNIKTDPLSLNFDFWLSCSQLIYNLGAFGIFLTFHHFTSKILNTQYYNEENRQILASLWGVHNVLLFLASLLTWVGVLWIVYRRKSTSS
jgi:hypothetical protein